jgi:hypothetical protein
VNSKFQIAFEAQKYSYSNGHISVDDVSFENCALPLITAQCKDDEFRCARGSCVSMDRICDLVDDCGDRSDHGSA